MGIVSGSDYYYFSKGSEFYLLDIPNSFWYHVNEAVAHTMDLARDLGSFGEIEATLTKQYGEDMGKRLINEFEDILNAGGFKAPDLLPSISTDPFQHKALTIHVANQCNLNCKYCFGDGGSYGQRPGLMNEETGRKAIDFTIANFSANQNLEINFFGGEPLLNWKCIQAIVEYATTKGRKFVYTFTTNGTIYNEELINFLKRHHFSFQVSLDGDCATHDRLRQTKTGEGTYGKIMEFISLLKERQVKVPPVRMTYTHYNPYISKLTRHLSDLGATQLSMAPVMANDVELRLTAEDLSIVGQEIEHLFEHYKEYLLGTRQSFIATEPAKWLKNVIYYHKADFGCGMGKKSLAVAVDGSLYPCHRFVGMEAFCVGSLDKGINYERLHTIVSTTVEVRSGCKECWARYFCSGACLQEVANSEGTFGSPRIETCVIIKKYLEQSVLLYSYLLEERRDILAKIAPRDPDLDDLDC